MTKLHTKGPWILSGRTIMEDFGPIGCGRAIAIVVGGCGSDPYFVEDPAEKHANANLIAAAPELLEVLERVIRRLEIAHANGDSIMREWVVEARAAVVRATGEPQ